MMDPLMTDLTDRLEELAKAATPGPWHVEYMEFGKGPDTHLTALLCDEEGRPFGVIDEEPDGYDSSSPNLEYIAAVSPDVILSLLEDRKALIERVKRLEYALTPSADTKAAYMGEFRMGVRLHAPNGDEDYRSVQIPWTTIKEIMKAISARAALEGKDG